MRLKMLERVHRHQNTTVCLTSAGAYKWSKLGDVVELPDAAGYEVLKKYPKKFQQVADEKPKQQDVVDPELEKAQANAKKTDKMVGKAPENKAIRGSLEV